MSKPESKAESRWAQLRKELRWLVHGREETRWHKKQISRARRRADRQLSAPPFPEPKRADKPQ